MFDKVFKVILLVILLFAAYGIYLNSQRNRFEQAAKLQIIFDTQTGKQYYSKLVSPQKGKLSYLK